MGLVTGDLGEGGRYDLKAKCGDLGSQCTWCQIAPASNALTLKERASARGSVLWAETSLGLKYAETIIQQNSRTRIGRFIFK